MSLALPGTLNYGLAAAASCQSYAYDDVSEDRGFGKFPFGVNSCVVADRVVVIRRELMLRRAYPFFRQTRGEEKPMLTLCGRPIKGCSRRAAYQDLSHTTY